jgi:hypothetical protein
MLFQVQEKIPIGNTCGLVHRQSCSMQGPEPGGKRMLRVTRLAPQVSELLHIHMDHNAWQDEGIRIENFIPLRAEL